MLGTTSPRGSLGLSLHSTKNTLTAKEGSLVFFAYFGPETTVPLASVLAASLGFLMMMGRGSIRFASRVIRGSLRWFDPASREQAARPHLRLSGRKKGARRDEGGKWIGSASQTGVQARDEHTTSDN